MDRRQPQEGKSRGGERQRGDAAAGGARQVDGAVAQRLGDIDARHGTRDLQGARDRHGDGEGGDAEQRERIGREGTAMPAEVTGAQVRAASLQQHAAAGEADRDAERRADGAEQRALGGEQGHQAVACDAQRAQQCEFLAAARGLQREGREHQEGARREGHHRERVEVDPIGAADRGRATGE